MTARARWSCVALALAGATCLAIAVQATLWWSLGDVVGVAPTGTRSCFDGADCMKGDLAWLGGGELWRRAGVATWTAGLITAVALVALAGSLAARRRGNTAAGVVLVSTMTAAVAGVVFVLRMPGMRWPQGMAEGLPSPTVTYGPGVFLYFGGVLAAGLVSILILRRGGETRVP